MPSYLLTRTEEDELIDTIKKVSLEQRKTNCPLQRVIHSKQYACLTGQFLVMPNLPEKLKAGLFLESRTYPCWIRLSSFLDDPDSNNSVRGISIKIMPDKTDLTNMSTLNGIQDFLLATTPFFPFSTEKDFYLFFKAAQSKSKWKILSYFFSSFKHLRSFYLLLKIARIQKKLNTNLLDKIYYSITPFQLGSQVVKYKVQPKSNRISCTNNTNNLKDALKEQVKNEDIYLDFMIQLQIDPLSMPINDASVCWNSPFEKIAEIKIPAQEFDFNERIHFGNELTFDPWNCLSEHIPLGGLNQLRKVVYKNLVALRKK